MIGFDDPGVGNDPADVLQPRRHQEARVADIERLGFEPYLLPRGANSIDDFKDMTSHPNSIVYRWATDEVLTERREAFEKARAEFEEAETEFNRLRETAKPLTEAEIRGKTKGEFAVNHAMRLMGTDYAAGQVIPQAISDALPFTKIHLWLERGSIRTVN